MKKMIKIPLFLIIAMLILSACSKKNEKEDLFSYKDSYVGDNSAMSDIVKRLQIADCFEKLELQTNERPYGMTVYYDVPTSLTEHKENLIYNATYLFALVQNVDTVTFDFDGEIYNITRETLENWYDEQLSSLKDEVETEALIEKQLEDEKRVEQLFEA